VLIGLEITDVSSGTICLEYPNYCKF